MALEASAEERETRGFISMMTMRPSSGLMANWTLEPPVSTPILRSTASEALRMIWYSLSVRVWAGATVIESPVCTPIGSKFSIEQTMMQLSARSDHFHLEFLPAQHGFLQQHLAGRRQIQAAFEDLDQLFTVVGDTAAAAAQGEDGRRMVGKPIS